MYCTITMTLLDVGFYNIPVYYTLYGVLNVVLHYVEFSVHYPHAVHRQIIYQKLSDTDTLLLYIQKILIYLPSYSGTIIVVQSYVPVE